MGLSIQREVSDGTLKRVSLTIQFINREDISVLINDTITTAYIWDGRTAIVLNTVQPIGTIVKLVRKSNQSKMKHIFSSRAVFREQTVDENFAQLLMLQQESAEGSGLSDLYADLDMHGFKLKNMKAAEFDNDAVTYGQYRIDALGAGLARDQAVAAQITASAAAASADVDAIQTAADRVQTGLDRVKTTADASKTGQDRAALEGMSAKITEIQNLVASVSGAKIPVGAILPMAVPVGTVIAGWLPMGSTFSKATYPQLGALYPTGVLPAVADDFIRGAGVGRPTGTRESWATENHTHWITHLNGSASDFIAFADNNPDSTYATGSNIGSRGDAHIGVGGMKSGAIAAETRPRNVAFPYYIKALDAVDQPEILYALQLADRVAALEAENVPLVPPTQGLISSAGCSANAPVLLDATPTSFTHYQSSSTPNVVGGTRSWSLPQYAGFKIVNVTCHSIQSSSGEANRISAGPPTSGQILTVHETYVGGGSRVGIYITYRKT